MRVKHILHSVFVGVLFSSVYVSAQDGGTPAAGGSGDANPFASYKCDPNVCKLPNCYCASTQPPVATPPQFLLVTYDDAVQAAGWGPANALLANRKNPNGCPAQATFFVSTLYSDPYLMTQWYAAGNELASHTVTHAEPFTATYPEIEGNRYWATSLSGIPRSKFAGFRHPFLNYTKESLELLAKMGFLYDSSMSGGGGADGVWPYTLDYGSVNDCLNGVNVCGRDLDAKGLWEIPMATLNNPVLGTQLMDPFNEPNPFNATSPSQVTTDYTTAFTQHYTTNRAPFGVYTHPVWLGAAQLPAIPDGSKKLEAVQRFLDYAMGQKDVWMVTGRQVVEYMKNPVPADQLGSQPYMQCVKEADIPKGICNGIGDGSLAELCNFAEGPFRTCYGCPSTYPTLQTPSTDPTSTRCRLPDTCDTLYWDPIG
ncbi:hypothetical protein HK097_001867, partial [Rhizophlyctis rosea]